MVGGVTEEKSILSNVYIKLDPIRPHILIDVTVLKTTNLN